MTAVKDRRERAWGELNIAPTDVKRQHYVPRMYLRAFADERGRILVRPLGVSASYATSIENAAVESRYYNFKIDDITVSAEEWLADIESAAAPIITRLIEDPSTITALTHYDQIYLARFVTAMFLRVPAMRKNQERLRREMLEFVKDMTRRVVYRDWPKEAADEIWADWEQRPDEWFLQEGRPHQPALSVASTLSNVQRYTNLLLVMPWRVGLVPREHQLYTSDNPVARYLPPVRSWWDEGVFLSFDYYVPLSPWVLLKIEHISLLGVARNDVFDLLDAIMAPAKDPGAMKVAYFGARSNRDFTRWEASVARHIITEEADSFLFGDAPIVPKDCATQCLKRIKRATMADAIRSGFDPRPPEIEPGVWLGDRNRWLREIA